MYPFFRMAMERIKHRNAGALGPGETHVSHHLCLPGDLDIWNELNNGRTLTLFDFGRLSLIDRNGIINLCKQNGWGPAIAGASVRYRKRIKLLDRIEMRSTLIGWDARFYYIPQSMWRRGECANEALYRVAIVGAQGIVAPAEIARILGWNTQSPDLPDWVQAWCDAENLRPWPPVS
ncbi:acyl-CoA thioesterase [Actibacterium sp. XHP0104]|uniref:acyl-CoA thioesterase n=1 Tax=Actibacterium sp. XHP0104 TaxID=2984335 RepID=UPI0021E748EB|nr:acyl-CoA thioesterase [Actibacterium sp. XHP0104]MCV2881751.1 thioesterase family protein [Actibacterium sp. XHP0104]